MKAVQASPNRVSSNTAFLCGYCSKPAEKLQQCARCHFILYCNLECQTKHWPTHKLDCHSKYIHVVQNSAAIILNDTTSKKIHYLYTNGLKSCVAIMAKGEHGIALLHDGGYLTEKSIKAVFQQLGTLEFWATAANPNVDKDFSKNHSELYQMVCARAGGFYPTQIERIRQIMIAIDVNALSKQKKTPNSDYYSASETWVCMHRNGEIHTQKNPEFTKSKPVEESTLVLRETINILNSLLPRKELACHLQFDGENFTPVPQLICDENTIQSIAKINPIVANFFAKYGKAKCLV